MSMGPARDLGPCILAWGADTLGPFWEEVRFKFEETFAEVFESAFGTTPVDTVFTGSGPCELTVPFTRITLAQLISLTQGGSQSGTAPSGNMTVDAIAQGVAMYDNSKPLFVKPIVAGVAAANGSWLRLEHAYPVPLYDIVYNNKDQRVYNVVFKGFPDATTRKQWSVGKVNGATT
ncbi:MAG: hypothetical protein WC551_09070 [Patescibacteria group bacterium]